MRRFPFSVLLIGLFASAGADSRAYGMRGVPEFDASDARSPVATTETLEANERFWPYQVLLARPFEGGRTIPAGTRGVLVRIERGGEARIDFGRDGVYQVPIAHTDVVERANRIRVGELDKMLPNFVHAVGPRLLDPRPAAIGPLRLEDALAQRGFLSVFAAPDDPRLPEIAKALGPLTGRNGVMPIYFPQGRHADRVILERLLGLDWPVIFVMDALSEGYTEAQLGSDVPLPAITIQTPDGREVYRSVWAPGVAVQAAGVIDRVFPQASQSAAR